MDDKLWEKELWTQQEVADYFRVVPGTVKNWRDQGYLSYWQAPGSTRVLYFSDEIKDFMDGNTHPRKGGDKIRDLAKIKRKKPDISSTQDKQWRI
jgi:hypothetical protein